MEKLLSPKLKSGFAPLLIIGLVGIIVFVVFITFGPLNPLRLGQLGSRLDKQESQAADEGATQDSDSDGFTDIDEVKIGTNPYQACATSSDDINRNGTSKVWPGDLYAKGTSYNKIDIQDIASFTAPIRRLDTSPGDPKYDVRWDVVPGKGAFGKDINIQDLTKISTFTAPMFNGQKAFNGPVCKELLDPTLLAAAVVGTQPPCYFKVGNSPTVGGYGDLNNDNKSNSVDALTALRIAAGLSYTHAYSDGPLWTYEAGDVNDTTSETLESFSANKSSDINSVDALLILRYAAGLNPTFPACLGNPAGEIITISQGPTISVSTSGLKATFTWNPTPAGDFQIKISDMTVSQKTTCVSEADIVNPIYDSPTLNGNSSWVWSQGTVAHQYCSALYTNGTHISNFEKFTIPGYTLSAATAGTNATFSWNPLPEGDFKVAVSDMTVSGRFNCLSQADIASPIIFSPMLNGHPSWTWSSAVIGHQYCSVIYTSDEKPISNFVKFTAEGYIISVSVDSSGATFTWSATPPGSFKVILSDMTSSGRSSCAGPNDMVSLFASPYLSGNTSWVFAPGYPNYVNGHKYCSTLYTETSGWISDFKTFTLLP